MLEAIMHKAWSAFVLIGAVLLTASVTSTYMLFIAFPVGAPMALRVSDYWFHVWIGFDKLCNAALGGDHDETISSRLGKSTIWGHAPVFGSLKIDKLVAWMLHQIDTDHCKKSVDWKVGVIMERERIAA